MVTVRFSLALELRTGACFVLAALLPPKNREKVLPKQHFFCYLLGLAPNRRLVYDILCGVFYVVGQDEEGNLTSLSPAAIEKYQTVFATPDMIDAEEAKATIAAMFYAL